MKGRRNRILSLLFVLLRIGALVYLGFFLLLVALQRQFMYFPTRGSEQELLDAAGGLKLLPWRDSAGRLIGWRSRHDGQMPRNRLVVFHGNAGHALQRDYFAEGFTALEKGNLWEVYLFEYPGYGARPGTPKEKEFLAAARAALAPLLREDTRPVFLLGESLGTGVATQAAAAFPEAVAGLFLVTPFTNLPDVAAHHHPIFPVRPFVWDRYASDEALKRYRGRVAFLLTGQDEVVPLRLGRRLYDGYAGPKRLWIQEDVMHNTIDYSPGAGWWREISGFLLNSGEAA